MSEEYFGVYKHYSSLLRSWFIAYGIGGPVVLLTNERVWDAVVHSGQAQCIGCLFLFGVALQVLIAATNKFIMWGSYYGEIHEEFQCSRLYAVCRWLRRQFWIDLIVDIATMVLLFVATYLAFGVLTSGERDNQVQGGQVTSRNEERHYVMR